MKDFVEIKFDKQNKILKKLNRYKDLSIFIVEYKNKNNFDEFYIDAEGCLFGVEVEGRVVHEFKSRLDLKTGLSWIEPYENFAETNRSKQRCVHNGSFEVVGICRIGLLQKQKIRWRFYFEHGCLLKYQTIQGPQTFAEKPNNKRKRSKLKNFLKKMLRLKGDEHTGDFAKLS